MSLHEELSAPLLTTDNYLLQPLHISELGDSAIKLQTLGLATDKTASQLASYLWFKAHVKHAVCLVQNNVGTPS